ncbi:MULTISPECIES: ATP-binding cassette domain-containing protein [Pseudoalteromonas]|jgi:putative thiamine transport system ATP-binding protein|uniref:ATP-binding cassette domain-containing protein n=1 Tax=Pseudoalteromonas arctica TaxID=394751 RepID=A0AAP6Y6V1_9GAMM|nr:MULTISPECIES: ATP-binding cassette domain-containing protein [Pseudoalteromonas]EGI73139.1 ABC transporter, ATP-binding protein YnjD [Pseudoalteromonas distincta]MBB1277434.1 ATP-binding cassette domain-containing protein [Pseudoalteromonas sp. SR43-3]MBB1278988.1 ATP-binding cassette domain-containing protein [Pseudoalteromonas sp. SR41-1]MBB1454445.1 ATP-binding cassette domain-containing protein [Pseudoalteromonas sp. SG43-5]MBH0000547.1 ATP-binding cassette domain-containing protein [Ps|tara:strand:+ start:26483 stop:27121 length:639 start_codon:yes stop_codon:yes gene_type:complete
MQSSLQIKNCQLYRQNELLLSLNEQVNGGEILTIMGPSGSGKSSLLNWLTGTLPSSFKANGEVWLNGQNIDNTPPHLRHIGVLYQDALLFSHLTVAGNIAFAMPKGNKKQRLEKIEHALEQVGLKDMGNRHPDNLSGGQQARVALLRMLLSEPKAILLDEPFSKLDTQLRVDTRELVFSQIRDHKLPAIMVTHDHSDADAANGKLITLNSAL